MTDSSSSSQINIGQSAKGIIGQTVTDSTYIEHQTVITPEAIDLQPFQARSPYKALKRFDVDDVDYFFGRYQLTLELQAALKVSNLILVLGASGSGKSSVVRAKLIPEFLGTSDKRHNFVLTPKENPFQSLYESFIGRDQVGRDKDYCFSAAKAQFVLEGKADVLMQVVRQLKDEDSEWLIFIDQFEELFTRCTNLEQRKNFMQSLTQMAESKERSVKLVLAMRADFLEQFSPYPRFGQLVQRQIHLVTNMPEDELELAIKGPAAKHGVRFEPGLTKEIIQDVQGQAGSLPLMQYTLDRLWKYEFDVDGLTDRTLNTQNYRVLGKVRGALEKHVNEIYDELSAAGQQAAKRIFLSLVKLVKTDGVVKPVSQSMVRSELLGEAVPTTLDRLINENLLVGSSKHLSQVALPAQAGKQREQQATIEIAHEILLSSWKLLEGWIGEAKEILLLKSRLVEDMGRWQDQKQANEELLKGSALEKILEFKKAHLFELQAVPLSAAEETYLDASLRFQKRELNRARRVAVGASIGVVFMAIAALFAVYQWQQAQRQRVEQLAATAQVLLATQPVEAEINAIAATGLSQSAFVQFPDQPRFVTAESILLDAVGKNPERNRLSHETTVTFVAFSPDGKTIVSGSLDKSVRLWDAQTGAAKGKPLIGHQAAVYSVAFSPDGKTIVSSSVDKSIRLWDAQTGAAKGKPLIGHEAAVSSVAFSPDGKTIVSGSADKSIRLWDVQTGAAKGKPFTGHQDGVESVAFSPDGKTIVSGSRDKSVRLWDAQTGAAKGKPFTGHENVVNSVAFSPVRVATPSGLGYTIVSGSADKSVRLWDAQTGAAKGEPFTGHQDEVRSVAFSPDGKTIVSASRDKSIRLWDAQTGAAKGEPLIGHQDTVSSVAFSPDGKTIVSASRDKSIRLWDAQTRAAKGEPLTGHQATVSSVAFSPDGKTIVSGSDDNSVRLWDAKTGATKGTPFIGHQADVNSVAFSPDGKMIVSGSADKSIRLWDAQTGAAKGKPFTGHQKAILSVAFSPVRVATPSGLGYTIVSGSSDKSVRLWDAQTGAATLTPLTGHEATVYSVAFSPDGKTIASGSEDKSVRLWDAQTGAATLTPLTGHEATVYSVAFSPDGKTIASGSGDKSVRLWDAQTGAAKGKPFTGHQAEVNSVAFSPDGKTIVSASEDKSVRLWDAQTGATKTPPLIGHQAEVRSVAFSPDGKTIVSGSVDKSVRLWDASSEGWLQIACGQLRHHLILIAPTTDVAREAKQTCEQYVWSKK